MSLVTEDGTGLANAESYISVADADARHTNLGNAAWTGATSVKEAALRRATQYMEETYRIRWVGFRVKIAQALSWPRGWVIVDEFPVPADIVPSEVANACADLALRALAGDLNADLTRTVIREKVGPIETEYNHYAPEAVRYRAIDMALGPFLKSSGASVGLVRV